MSELASLFKFLRLDPYCDKSIFDEHITKPWKAGYEDLAVKRMKKLLQFIMLRRPSTILELPDRHDFRKVLQFSPSEQKAYDVAKEVAIRSLDAALMEDRQQGAFINALQKINALRTFCNHGNIAVSASPSRNTPEDKTDGDWNTNGARRALREMAAAGLNVTCLTCLPTSECYSGLDTIDASAVRYVTRCLRIFCHVCYFDTISSGLDSAFCECSISCPVATASLDMIPEESVPKAGDADLREDHESTKVRAVVGDLDVWSPQTKW